MKRFAPLLLAWCCLPVHAGNAPAAAAEVARAAPACQAIAPFWWEIGDAGGARAGGRIGARAPTPDTRMAIASASKWIFSAYVVQRRGDELGVADVMGLNMTSGYDHMVGSSCWPGRSGSESVDSCFHAERNDTLDHAAIGRFDYNGGHFQKLAAVDLKLGKLDGSGLAAEIARVLGAEFAFTYVVPQLAGGVVSDATHYAAFLRAILGHHLAISDQLGMHKVCTNAERCPTAISSPLPHDERWSYSLGHWVEDDPDVGDGAFSSPGAFGFYPWIDANKRWYGLIARHSLRPKAYYESVLCGRQIRAAWLGATSRN